MGRLAVARHARPVQAAPGDDLEPYGEVGAPAVGGRGNLPGPGGGQQGAGRTPDSAQGLGRIPRVRRPTTLSPRSLNQSFPLDRVVAARFELASLWTP